MHRAPLVRFSLTCCLALFLLGPGLGCSPRQNPWLTPSQGEALAEKVKTSQNAFLRLQDAEAEARQDGNAVAAERYRVAKEAAYQEYVRDEQALRQYEADRSRRASQDQRRP